MCLHCFHGFMAAGCWLLVAGAADIVHWMGLDAKISLVSSAVCCLLEDRAAGRGEIW